MKVAKRLDERLYGKVWAAKVTESIEFDYPCGKSKRWGKGSTWNEALMNKGSRDALITLS